MINRMALELIYQPAADFAAKRLGTSCYQVAAQCAIGSGVAWIIGEAIYLLGHWSAAPTRAVLSALWCVVICSKWKEANRLHASMMAGKPTSTNDTSSLYSAIWIVFFATDVALFGIDLKSDSLFRMLNDALFLSMRWFMMCRPMRPKEKKSEAPTAILQGAS